MSDNRTSLRALENRVYKTKNPALEFYCPLCRTPRSLTYKSKLSLKNYAQIAAISIVLMCLTFPIMGVKVFFWPLVVFVAFEMVLKMFFRKQIPCPHCGFDATWYKRDVRVARRMVEDFWKQKNPEQAQQNA